MIPWIVDADDIQLSSDFDTSSLCHTPGIDEFLDSSGRRCILLATKGFGKTLLLKAQRIAYQDRMFCLPENTLIDKPIGDHVFDRNGIAFFSDSTENWKKLWLASIATAVLKATNQTDGLSVSGKLRQLIEDRHVASVMDHFVNILAYSRRDFQKASETTTKLLLPRLRQLDTPVAVFVDSLDEFFHKHIMSYDSGEVGEISPGIWIYSQMALVEAAYDLRKKCTHHLKVFGSLRKEAFEKCSATTEMMQQYRDSIVDLHYSSDSLRKILISNIRAERPSNLVDRTALKQDPLPAFFGIAQVTHSFTKATVDIFNYVVRHTMCRPRDLMTICGRISRLPPEKRNEETIKDEVNRAATEIASEYLSEISPSMRDVHLNNLFSLLKRNVFTREEAEAIELDYCIKCDKTGFATGRNPLAVLYAAGLIGVVRTDHVKNCQFQAFLRPGEMSVHLDNPLPDSNHYLVHPILSGLVIRMNGEYAAGIDKTNLVGIGLPWKEPLRQRTMCVLKADIRGFSKIMGTPEEMAVREQLQEALESNAPPDSHFGIEGGDSFFLVHEDTRSIIKAAKRIMEDLFEAPSSPILRIGIDRGVVEYSEDQTPNSGAPFRTAARLEARVDSGERGGIWVTDKVQEHLGDDAMFFHLDGPEAINIRKADSNEDDNLMHVYRVVF